MTEPMTEQMNGHVNAAPIVVGVDGSPASLAALNWAVAEATVSGREVRAVAAWSYAPALDPGGVVMPVDEMAAAHQRTLEELIGKVTGGHPAVPVHPELIEGEPAEALLEASKGASMLVLGSHGHGRLMKVLLGSVSARCVRRADCPVVIIPAHTAGERAGTQVFGAPTQ
jgi:nucleotide-binding universal stress UspA family protein